MLSSGPVGATEEKWRDPKPFKQMFMGINSVVKRNSFSDSMEKKEQFMVEEGIITIKYIEEEISICDTLRESTNNKSPGSGEVKKELWKYGEEII